MKMVDIRLLEEVIRGQISIYKRLSRLSEDKVSKWMYLSNANGCYRTLDLLYEASEGRDAKEVDIELLIYIIEMEKSHLNNVDNIDEVDGAIIRGMTRILSELYYIEEMVKEKEGK